MLVRKSLFVTVAVLLALTVFAALIATAQAASVAAPLAPDAVTAVQYASGLTEPVEIVNTGLLTDTRLFVAERGGRIRVVVSNGPTGTVLGTDFLDISGIVDSASHGEMGLLGMAFSPNYATNGQFFVYYNRDADNIHVARYTVSADPNVANITGTVILTIPHAPANNHNGGDLAFGPDGFLYLAPGDGGSSSQSAQNLDLLLGKVLRLNVTGVPTYTIPITNPYVGVTGRDEIWATGLRNPFRFTFDRQTGDMYIGDVGAGSWEEIDFQPAGTAGLDYGWPCYEGDHVSQGCTPVGTYSPPVAEYCNSHSGGCVDGGVSVMGGYVYRGSDYPGLVGYYFYADNGSSRFWALRPGTWAVTPLNITNVSHPGGFGESVDGELYVTAMGTGRLYRLQGALVVPIQTPSWLPLIRR